MHQVLSNHVMLMSGGAEAQMCATQMRSAKPCLFIGITAAKPPVCNVMQSGCLRHYLHLRTHQLQQMLLAEVSACCRLHPYLKDDILSLANN